MPKPPIGLSVSDVTATSVRLSWNVGGDDPVESFVVQYRRKYAPGSTYDEVADIANTEYTVTGLSAYTIYEFRVLAANNIGRGLPSQPPLDVPTGEMR